MSRDRSAEASARGASKGKRVVVVVRKQEESRSRSWPLDLFFSVRARSLPKKNHCVGLTGPSFKHVLTTWAPRLSNSGTANSYSANTASKATDATNFSSRRLLPFCDPEQCLLRRADRGAIKESCRRPMLSHQQPTHPFRRWLGGSSGHPIQTKRMACFAELASRSPSSSP